MASTFTITAYDRLVRERRAMVFNGGRQTEVYEDEPTARRDARLIASNPRYQDVRVEEAGS
jgi:hypothetical protein